MIRPKILFIINHEDFRKNLELLLSDYLHQNGFQDAFEVISLNDSQSETNYLQNETFAYLGMTFDKLLEHIIPLEILLQSDHAPFERILFVQEKEWSEAGRYYFDGTVNHLIPMDWSFPHVLNRFLYDCRMDLVTLTNCRFENFEKHLEWERLQQVNFSLSQQNRKLLTQASIDGLTGLTNRREFDRIITREVARSNREKRPFSIIMCDVDFFKHYNDHFGHPAGDEVLKKIAELIRKRLRISDVAARYGGEEFVILLPNTAKEQAIKVAEDLRVKIEQYEFPNEKLQPNGNLTMSLGVSTHGEDGTTVEAIIESADKELYRAKHCGRNCVKASTIP